MIELFDKKFVHFMWDDKLEGKRGFLSSGIDTLIKMVNEDSDRTAIIQKGCERDLPFRKHLTVECRLAYYDPNYEAKRAFNEGKVVQYLTDKGQWETILSNMELMSHIEKSRQLRIKPEEKKNWIVYLARKPLLDKSCYLTSCRGDMWESVQKDYGAKTKLFIGTENKAIEWYKSHQKFAEVIKAWEDGKKIQFYSNIDDKWTDLQTDSPYWDAPNYRIKPEDSTEFLTWKDLKIGDVLRRYYDNGDYVSLAVNGINSISEFGQHILLGNKWIPDEELKIWEKE